MSDYAYYASDGVDRLIQGNEEDYKLMKYRGIISNMKNTKFEKADKKAGIKEGSKKDADKLPARMHAKNNIAKAMKPFKK